METLVSNKQGEKVKKVGLKNLFKNGNCFTFTCITFKLTFMNLKSLFLTGLLFPVLYCLSQADTEAEISKGKTKLSKIALREGAIIAKKFEDIGTFTTKGLFFPGTGNLAVQFVTLTDAASSESLKGYLFSTNYAITTGYYQNYTSFVDIEEVPGLVKYLEFIESKISSPEKDIEYWFNSKDLSIAVFYQAASGKRAEKWSYLLRVDRAFRTSTFNFSSAESFLEFATKIRTDFAKRGQ